MEVFIMSEIILSVKDVDKIFANGKIENKVLDAISIDFLQKDFTVIMGPSGAGKSTLLYSISGMESVSSGSIIFQEYDLANANEKELAKLRSQAFGFVFQQANLVSNLTLRENICVHGYFGQSGFFHNKREKEIQKYASMLIHKMNLREEVERYPSECSGGENQRAAIARAVINQPDILFADEPTGALNRANTMEVLDLFTSLNVSGQSIIMVTHDIHAAMRGNRIIYLEDGHIKGELKLSEYQGENSGRENKVLEWLKEMEW